MMPHFKTKTDLSLRELCNPGARSHSLYEDGRRHLYYRSVQFHAFNTANGNSTKVISHVPCPSLQIAYEGRFSPFFCATRQMGLGSDRLPFAKILVNIVLVEYCVVPPRKH